MAGIETQIERVIGALRCASIIEDRFSRKSLASLPVSNPEESLPRRQLRARESSERRTRELSTSSRKCFSRPNMKKFSSGKNNS